MAVCVKGLDASHGDYTFRLTEWIELTLLLGAHKIFFYMYNAHPNVHRLLKYYEDKGVLEVIPITLAGFHPNTVPELQHLFISHNSGPKRLHEMIAYNDCLYKHMYQYEVRNRYLTSLSA